jgi:hypothetical protein
MGGLRDGMDILTLSGLELRPLNRPTGSQLPYRLSYLTTVYLIFPMHRINNNQNYVNSVGFLERTIFFWRYSLHNTLVHFLLEVQSAQYPCPLSSGGTVCTIPMSTKSQLHSNAHVQGRIYPFFWARTETTAHTEVSLLPPGGPIRNY